MKQFKFRVWDGKLMHNVAELHFCMGPKLDGNGLKFYGPSVGSGWIDGEGTILMQYTGLKDRSGKEIYEGDIIKYDFDGETKVDVIEFSPPMFTVRSAIRWSFNRDEVIGNIYENPKLVKDDV